MSAVVVYPDVVKVALDYLRPALAARPEQVAEWTVVAAKVPNPRPTPLVVLRLAGGTSPYITLDRPRLDVQVWHGNEYNATALAQLVRGLLLAMAGVGPVRRVADFLGPTPVPDPESGASRVLFTVEINIRGA
jgi:hypothetical protein